MTAAWTAYRKAAHLGRWSSAGDHLPRLVAPRRRPIATPKQQDWSTRTAGSAIADSWTSRKRFKPPDQSTFPTMPAAAKSP
jgi:hypothetical protein